MLAFDRTKPIVTIQPQFRQSAGRFTQVNYQLPDMTRTTQAVKICCNNIYHRGMQFYIFYNNTVL